MGHLNNIFNSLRVISEGSNYSTTGFTVTNSGNTSDTSFMVRDGGYVGIGTNVPNDGVGGNANLHVVGNARITNIPTGGNFNLTTDGFGNILKDNTPIIRLTGDCVISSAYTTGVSGCTLYMVTNCTGSTGVLVNGYISYTADTCNSFSDSPYEWGIGTNSIQPILLANFANATYSSIGGGFAHDVTAGSNYSRIGGGFNNNIIGDTFWGYIGGGLNNNIITSTNSSIVGGLTNLVDTGPGSNIGGGHTNQIQDASYSSILGGSGNRVSGATWSAIINGLSNVVNHTGSVIMNGPAMTSDDDYTTYTRGLNVDSTNLSATGAKYFKYHGPLAGPGLGKVLVDSTGFGDAVWENRGIYSWTGDCAVVSAYTSGCTLYILTNCTGSTGLLVGGHAAYTANTCNTFGAISPYTYKGGQGSISTVTPGVGFINENLTSFASQYSSIGGGQRNSIITMGGVNNTICAGNFNEIGPKRDLSQQYQFGFMNNSNNFIGAGRHNKIRGAELFPTDIALDNAIVAGYGNIITGSSASSIVGGVYNEIWGTTHLLSAGFTNYSFIGGGIRNIIKPDAGMYLTILGGIKNEIRPIGEGLSAYFGLSTNSTILGGRSNVISASTYASIVNGTGNTITANIKGIPNYSSIINGINNRIVGPHNSSVILGGDGIISSTSHTTHTNGLNVDTDSVVGTRSLIYHGGYANEGTGRILTSDSVGNASWQDPGFIPGLSGDCVVSTAYTINCTLYMITNCTGDTAPGRLLIGDHIAYTADTCNTFGGISPYTYGLGLGAIQTTLALSNNSANGNWFDVVSGGRYNKTNYFSYQSGIQAGYNNEMTGATQSFIGAGKLNRVVFHEDGAIVAGIGNYLGTINKTPGSTGAPGLDDLKNSFIGAGAYNEILKSEESSIVGGQYNLLRETYQSFIGGGDHNILTGDSGSVLVGGYYNTMKSAQRTFIGGGAANEIHDGQYNALVGGYGNLINNSSNYNFMAGGSDNVLGDTTVAGHNTDYSSILGGKSNTIKGDSDADYAAIVNGQSNTVTANYAAIIGGQSLTADRTHTTFMNGLDVDVASSSGTRYLRYHGSGSNVGTAGDVLTSINTSGDAIWTTPIAPGASWTGDCAVVSAYTYGCTLYMLTDCTGATGTAYILVNGNITYTANTCNTFDGSPYRYGGNSAIEPIIGTNNATGFRSNVGGGQTNRIDSISSWSSILGGVNCSITGASVSAIVSGHRNKIYLNYDGYGAIINGYQNTVSHPYSVVMGGSDMKTKLSFTTYTKGLDVDSSHTTGVPSALDRYFRYHGNLANEGLNRILTDVDGTGNAVWRNGAPNISWTGDQFVVSAYTTGCTLHVVTNSGNTYTANTCNNMTPSPYMYGVGNENIQPVLPTNNPNIHHTYGSHNNIAGGADNKIWVDSTGSGSVNSSIEGGQSNTISGCSNSNITNGGFNVIDKAIGSSIVGGSTNKIISRAGSIGQNIYTGIFQGIHNTILNHSITGLTNQGSTIIGGQHNMMSGTTNSSIIGGYKNTILSSIEGIDFKTSSVILGGTGNTLTTSAISSAIIGGDNLRATRSHTTYMNGLDVDTYTLIGERPLIYHGAFANEGIGKILTSDIAGRASWQSISIPPSISFTGDCVISSAYTTNCTLWAVTNCTGSTGILVNGYIAYTADTCNSFSDSPYEYRGVNSISTKLPGGGNPGDNFIRPTTPWSNIGGGQYNKHNTSGPGYSNISGGYDNTIGGSDTGTTEGYSGYDFIGGGKSNKITGTDTFHQTIVGGTQNWVLKSNGGFIGGGTVNIITGSTSGFIGGGSNNKLLIDGDYSVIVGGQLNTIYSKNSNIGGGKLNTISSPLGGTTEYAGIFNGSGNTIGRAAEYSAIIGSRGINYANSPETTYMKGLDANTNGYDGTDRKFKYHGTFANHGTAGYVLTASDTSGNAQWLPAGIDIPVSGDCYVESATTVGCVTTFYFNNTVACSGLTFTAKTCDGSYSPYRPTGTDSIVPTVPGLLGFGENIIDVSSNNSSIGGGTFNSVTDNSNTSVISGGRNNILRNTSIWSNIGGGVSNIIDDSLVSSILGGHQNEINISGITNGYGAIIGGYSNDVTGVYSTIVNGYGNTASKSYTTILNGQNVTTDLSYMAYIKGGLNIYTQSLTPRYFRYHGTLANEGASRVLTSDASGNATWQNSGMVSFAGDQFVVSAYTTGTTIHVVTNSGNTYTANTSNTFDNHPYQYGAGSNTIEPIMGSNSHQGGLYNNILGGMMNRTDQGEWPGGQINPSHYNSISGGFMNVLSGSQYCHISNGTLNIIENAQQSIIAGGGYNRIKRAANGYQRMVGIFAGRLNTIKGGVALDTNNSVTLGGEQNTISASTGSAIVGGYFNYVRSEADNSVILGSQGITASTPSTAYMDNSQAMGKSRISSHNYLSTNSLHNRLAKTALDVVHETSDLTGMAANTGGGEIVRFGVAGGDYAAGYLVQLQAGNWVKADAADVTYQGNMLGIALGAEPTNGILIRGFYTIETAYDYSGAESVGEPLYVSATDGKITNVQPSSTTQYVRAVGYTSSIISVTEQVLIYFNPDSTYITIV